jgi:hypothetical protein
LTAAAEAETAALPGAMLRPGERSRQTVLIALVSAIVAALLAREPRLGAVIEQLVYSQPAEKGRAPHG